MPQSIQRRQSFPLRLSDSLKREAHRLADEEQVSLNHFIALAIAEKLSRLEQMQLFASKGAEALQLSAPPVVPQTRFRPTVYFASR